MRTPHASPAYITADRMQTPASTPTANASSEDASQRRPRTVRAPSPALQEGVAWTSRERHSWGASTMPRPRATFAAAVTLGFVIVGLLVHQRAVTPAQAQATETVPLPQGCSNVTLPWPSGTPVAAVAEAISPPEALTSIWRYDAASRRFLGFAPGGGAANDFRSVAYLDAVFICLSRAGTLRRPLATTGGAPAAGGAAMAGEAGAARVSVSVGGATLTCVRAGGVTTCTTPAPGWSCRTSGDVTVCTGPEGRVTCTSSGTSLSCSGMGASGTGGTSTSGTSATGVSSQGARGADGAHGASSASSATGGTATCAVGGVALPCPATPGGR